ncbi:MAG: T9SS type A sorting domain-containing protein, partial [Flavobacterium sp.]|nr:T9SS type A sorting domain-containing protein [Flavobacterium sp.]
SIISSTGNCQAPGTRIIRVRITNSVPFASGTSCNHIFSTAVSAGIEKTAIFAYVGGQNTYVGTPQNFNYNTPGTCTDNVVFNSCIATTLTGVVTDEACLNSSNGTINLTALGGSPSPTFSWSGPSNYTSSLEDLSGLSPGQYTVTASSGACTSTASFTVLAGPSNTTNTTTAAACNSYSWNGTTYTASGVYTGTTTNCVTESLNLTITPSSTNTISVSACGTYTWPNNGQTYTTSGVYTGTTANCVTQSLNLTITPNTSVTTTINANDTYTWAANGITYTASGIYTGPTSANCVTQYLNLTINSSGISEEELVLFSLYPNPVSDMLYVNLNGQDNQDYLIIDNFGAVIKRGVLGNLINEISVSQLSSGLYYFKIEGTKPRKFSKID